MDYAKHVNNSFCQNKTDELKAYLAIKTCKAGIGLGNTFYLFINMIILQNEQHNVLFG